MFDIFYNNQQDNTSLMRSTVRIKILCIWSCSQVIYYMIKKYNFYLTVFILKLIIIIIIILYLYFITKTKIKYV